MEKITLVNTICRSVTAGAGILMLMLFSSTLRAAPNLPFTAARPAPVQPALPLVGRGAADPSPPPDEYQRHRPQPLMHGEGFNYDLYYNYRLTPHIILRPNLQQTTKPGAVEDNAQRFVGGLSAGIQF